MSLEQSMSNADTHSNLDCNICLDSSIQSVVSYCGHVFCWPCIYRWMEVQDQELFLENNCPVCKAIITRDKNSNNIDPRNIIPPRPLGQNVEQVNYNQVQMNFPEITSNTILASASFFFGNFGFRASFGPAQAIVGSWGEMEEARNSIGQIFIRELTRNLFFSVSLISFLYMLII